MKFGFQVARLRGMLRSASLCTAFAALVLAVAPAARAEDAYIEATGSQVLNTGYIVNPATKIVADYAFTDVTLAGGRRLFGVYHRDASAGYFFNTSGALIFESGSNNNSPNTTTGLKAVADERQVATLDFNAGTASVAIVGGATLWAGNIVAGGSVTSSATAPLALFSTTTAALPASNEFNAAAKLYSLKIFEDGTLVRDFEPALWDGPGGKVPGLRDAVTGLFISAHDLTGGVAPETDLKYGGDIATFTAPYLESDGTQALNTGVYMDNATRVEIDFAETATGQNCVLLGAWNFTGYNRLVLPYLNGGYIKISVGGSDANHGGGWVLDQKAVAENLYVHTAIADGPAQLLSLVTGVTTNKTFAMKHDFDTPANFPIGVFAAGHNAAGTLANMNAKARVYAVRIYKSGALSHEFLPALRNGVPGLRDSVSGAFLSDGDVSFSPKSTATAFSYGGDIPSTADPYIEADGTQGFAIPVSEYKINANTKLVVDYQFTVLNTGKRLFGVFQRGATTSLYQNSRGEIVIEGGDGKCYNTNPTGYSGDANTSGNLKSNLLRHTVTLSLGNQEKSSIVTGVTTNWSGNLTSPTTTGIATAPLAIFSTSTADTGPTSQWGDKAKIYRFQVYDGDELKYDLLPYVKDGTAGFRNAVDGSFYAPFFGGDALFGGDIDGKGDAYVQAVRTSGTVGQAINTEYYPTTSTKFVVDFKYDDTANDGRLFGAYLPKANRCGFYCKNNAVSGTYKFTIESPGDEQITSIGNDTKRHVLTVDYSQTASGSSSIATDGAVAWLGAVKGAITAKATNPLILFGTYTDSIGYFASARIYSFRIYEGGELVHEYLPYKNGDVAGFYDTKTRQVLTESTGNGALTVSGKGVDGADFWVKPLPEQTRIAPENTKELEAAAAGAQSYRWTLNGETIEGATGEKINVAWYRGGDYDEPDEYAVYPVYDFYGRDVEGEPAVCSVYREQQAFIIVVR